MILLKQDLIVKRFENSYGKDCPPPVNCRQMVANFVLLQGIKENSYKFACKIENYFTNLDNDFILDTLGVVGMEFQIDNNCPTKEQLYEGYMIMNNMFSMEIVKIAHEQGITGNFIAQHATIEQIEPNLNKAIEEYFLQS